MSDLQRYTEAQKQDFDLALEEVRSGRKRSHWMWYIFPQLTRLGQSEYAWYYGIPDSKAAREYKAHTVLGEHLLTITRALLQLEENDPHRVMGSPDDRKLCSCMTLFEAVAPEYPEFAAVLEKFYAGNRDKLTLQLLAEKEMDG